MMIYCNDRDYWYDVQNQLSPFTDQWEDGTLYFNKAMLKIAFFILQDPNSTPYSIRTGLEYFKSNALSEGMNLTFGQKQIAFKGAASAYTKLGIPGEGCDFLWKEVLSRKSAKKERDYVEVAIEYYKLKILDGKC